MMKQLSLLSGSLAAIAAVSAPAIGQGTAVPIGPHASVYNGYSRGYEYTAPSDHFIQQVELPTDALQVGDTASCMILVNGVQAFFSVGTTPANNIVPVAPPVQAAPGDSVVVIAHWSAAVTANFSAHNSYGTGAPYATTLLGQPIVLNRSGWQWDIGDPAYINATVLATGTGSYGRSTIYVTPPAGIFAGISTTTPTTGASPLTVDFADASFSDDPAGILLYEWDFENDGVVDSTLQNPTHTYTTCGVFDVTLTVTDAINGSNSTTSVGLVSTDAIVADFTVSPLAPQVWEFTDASVPPATSWAWDFDNDGTVDDTNNPAFYVSPTAGACLNLPDVSYTATLACNSDTKTGPVFAATNSFIGESGGGNGTSSANGVGNYFDIEVTNPEGINVCGIGCAPYSFSGVFDCNVYITSGTHLGVEGNANAWQLVGSGQGVGVGAAFGAPVIAGVGMGSPFYLPPGNYGVGVFISIPGGGAANIAYTNGPATAPYVGTDLIIHPNGVGSSATSELGPVAFTPRLFNGGFYYDVCSVSGSAATGYYGAGCPGTLGATSTIDVLSMPTIGGTYSLDVNNIPVPGIGIMMTGLTNTVWNGLPLPFDLGVIGAPGCNLLQDVAVTSTIVGAPIANFSLAIPNNPALQCFKLFNQAAILDVTANGLGFSFSNAQAGVIGN